MNYDHKLIRNLLQNSLQTNRLNYSLLAKQLGVAPSTVGRWFESPELIKLQDANDLLHACGFGPVILRQPINPSAPIRLQLVSVRKQLGISATEIAAAIGVSAASIYGWERGLRRGASLDDLDRWARFLGMGGLTVEDVPPDATVSIELLQHPGPDAVRMMLDSATYWGHRYVPFSLEHAALRIQAHHKGIKDESFVEALHFFDGESTMLAKYRTPLLKLANKEGTVFRGSDKLVEMLEARRA